MFNTTKIEDIQQNEIDRLASMDIKTRKSVINGLEGTSQQKAALRMYIAELKATAANTANTKPSLWQRAKCAVARPFKAAARFVKRIPLPGFVWSTSRAVKTAAVAMGRFVARNWGYMLAGSVWLAAFVIAPIPTLVGTAFIAGSFALLNHDNWFVRAMGRALLDIGAQVIAEGVVDAVSNRNRN